MYCRIHFYNRYYFPTFTKNGIPTKKIKKHVVQKLLRMPEASHHQIVPYS